MLQAGDETVRLEERALFISEAHPIGLQGILELFRAPEQLLQLVTV